MDPPSMQQRALLVELQEKISDLDLSSDELEDKNLVRFLRARNEDLKQAEIMIRNNYAWKVKEDITRLMAEYECPEGWDETFPYDLVGFDRTGCPLFVISIGKWDLQKETAQGNKEEFVKFCYYTLEKVLTFLKYLSKDEDHMKQFVGIVDLSGLSWRLVTSIDAVGAIIRVVKAYEANFPDILKALMVINAPWCFQILWKMVKHIISDGTLSKLAFLGGDQEKWREALLELAEPDQFPACYGGTAPDSTKFFINRDGSWGKSENQNETSKYND